MPVRTVRVREVQVRVVKVPPPPPLACHFMILRSVVMWFIEHRVVELLHSRERRAVRSTRSIGREARATHLALRNGGGMRYEHGQRHLLQDVHVHHLDPCTGEDKHGARRGRSAAAFCGRIMDVCQAGWPCTWAHRAEELRRAPRSECTSERELLSA